MTHATGVVGEGQRGEEEEKRDRNKAGFHSGVGGIKGEGKKSGEEESKMTRI